MILDSGERTVHANGFQRDMHEGKGRMDLLPWRAIIEASKLCEEGAKKYGERNIDKGCPQHSLIDSAFRHLAKYVIGMTDEDHLRSAVWNLLWALEQQVCRPDMQDIPAVILAHQLREMNGGENIPTEGDIDKMNKELDALSAKHSGPGYQSGIRRGVREAREIFDKYVIGVTLDGREVEIPIASSPVEPFRYGPEFGGRRCVEMSCFYNTDGICQSVSDLWNPDLGEHCPDFSED